MCGFSRLITGDFKSFTWWASWQESCTFIPHLVPSQCTAVSEGSCSKGLGHPWLVMLCHKLPWDFILRTLYLRSWAEDLYERRRGNSDDTFHYSDSVSNTSLPPALPSCPFPLTTGSKNLPDSLAPATGRWPQCLCWST